MRQTGFPLIDGDPARNIAAATPRSWLFCLIAVIVAQWMFGFLVPAANFGVQLLSYAASFRLDWMRDWIVPLNAVAWLIAPFGVIAGLAMLWSWRYDKRGPAAFGLQWRAIPGAIPWIFAGLVCTCMVWAHVALLQDGWAEETLAAVVWLIPATIIQAGSEEILFRGLLLAILVARYGPRMGVFICALLFALWHLYPGQGLIDFGMRAVTMFIYGAVTALLVLHQGHLGGAIALHVVWNVAFDIETGTMIWSGNAPPAADVEGMFYAGTFWDSLSIGLYDTWTLESFQDRSNLIATIVPLALASLLIVGACRSTLDKLFEPRAPLVAQPAPSQ